MKIFKMGRGSKMSLKGEGKGVNGLEVLTKSKNESVEGAEQT